MTEQFTSADPTTDGDPFAAITMRYLVLRRKVGEQVLKDVTLSRENFLEKLFASGVRHHFYISLLITEQMGLKAAMAKSRTIRNQTELRIRGTSRIPSSMEKETKFAIDHDMDVQLAEHDVEMRKMYITYIEEVVDLHKSQRFVFNSIRSMLEKEES